MRKAHHLPGHCGKGSTGYAPVTDKDEERIEPYVEDCTRDDTHHGKRGVALKTQLVVEC